VGSGDAASLCSRWFVGVAVWCVRGVFVGVAVSACGGRKEGNAVQVGTGCKFGRAGDRCTSCLRNITRRLRPYQRRHGTGRKPRAPRSSSWPLPALRRSRPLRPCNFCMPISEAS
jgi:hypothetical protein